MFSDQALPVYRFGGSSMVKHRRAYNPERLGNPELARARKERYLRRQAEQLGFHLTSVEGDVS
jgi:hypothetical protein